MCCRSSSAGDHVGVRPLVEMSHAERDRQEEQRQHRQHARRRADRPADDDAPGAARQLVDHAEREAAERDAEHAACTPAGTTGRTAAGRGTARRATPRAPTRARDRAAGADSAASSGIGSSAVSRRAASLTALQSPLGRRHVGERRRARSAAARGCRPTIAQRSSRLDLRGVVGHGAEAVRDHVEEMADRRVAQPVVGETTAAAGSRAARPCRRRRRSGRGTASRRCRSAPGRAPSPPRRPGTETPSAVLAVDLARVQQRRRRAAARARPCPRPAAAPTGRRRRTSTRAAGCTSAGRACPAGSRRAERRRRRRSTQRPQSAQSAEALRCPRALR